LFFYVSRALVLKLGNFTLLSYSCFALPTFQIDVGGDDNAQPELLELVKEGLTKLYPEFAFADGFTDVLGCVPVR